MPWFKVDDGLHAHSKVVRAGIPAMGLWVVAGAWSADQLTDGFVPDYIAARLDSDYRRHAAKLVSVGLWKVAIGPNGDKGWAYHEWSNHQPTSDLVHAKRDEAKARMKRMREARKAEAQGETDDGSQDVRANTERTSREVRSTPTRPDPTHKRTTTNGPYVAPGPNGREVDLPPDEGTPGPAEKIVTQWVDGLSRPPQRSIVESIGGHVANALRDGCEPTDVAEALALWQRRGDLGPSVLPSLIHQITNPPTPGTNVVSYIGRATPAQRPSTTDQRVSEGLALAARFRREEEAEEATR